MYHDTLRTDVKNSESKKIRRNVEMVIHGNREPMQGIRRSIPLASDDTASAIDASDFVLRLRDDTLNIDTLRALYALALTDANINVGFVINQVTENNDEVSEFIRQGTPGEDFIVDHRQEIAVTEPERNISLSDIAMRDTIYSAPFRTSPFHQYAVAVFDIRAMLLRQIVPQIFFSIFLILMIAGAFMIMFRSLKSQERLMQAKNDLIGNISHELKTPVATVSVVLEALKNFHALDNQKLTQEYLEIAQTELNRLSVMTDKILKTAIFEDKGVEYVPEAVDMQIIVTQVLGSMKLVLEKNRADVVYTMAGEHFRISGSPVHLSHVVYNLVDNALKYCTGKPRIEITLTAYPDRVTLRIKDNGIGIDTVYHKKVFEKFFRVPTGDVHDTKGYGLGLNYVSSVVSRHHGQIELHSEISKGSEFTITWPKLADN
jgi:two-component system phosphate regulon sensor histidine kinase PhoR